MHQVAPTTFRKDINGLRAYAVMAVLFFHFQLTGFGAGFIGVDIFFVISGFLMTAIVTRALEQGGFSIGVFYLARLRRIAPALFVLIGSLLTLGWFVLPSIEYQSLGMESAYALAFASNLLYESASGYFDVGAYEKWLLHTWTLGVEAQFYLLLPIGFTFLWTLSPRRLTLALGVVIAFICSLALLFSTPSPTPFAASTSSFYLLPSRAWEFLAGGMAYFARHSTHSSKPLPHANGLFWLGVLLLAAAFTLIDGLTPWPSAWTLLPVIGTALIIASQQTQSRLTTHPVTQWLGTRSYSVYLWHWPIVVGLHFVGKESNTHWITGGVALSLLLSSASYRLIEAPTRRYLSRISTCQQTAVFITAPLLLLAASIAVTTFAFTDRTAKDVEALMQEKTNVYAHRSQCVEVSDITNRTTDCHYREDQPLGVIALGDSHASATFTALGEAASQHGFNAMHWAKNGCPTLKGAKSQQREQGCYAFNNDALSRLGTEFYGTPVVLISRLTRAIIGGNEDGRLMQGVPHVYFNEVTEDGLSRAHQAQFEASLIETSCLLAKTRPVYLMRPLPEMDVDVPTTLARNRLLGRANNDVKIALNTYHDRHRAVWRAQDKAASQCGARILNPLPYLCDTHFCYGSVKGRPLYHDGDHMSEHGNKRLVPLFESIFTSPISN